MRLEDVCKQLRQREPIFHRPEFGTARADFEAMICEDYWEVGASGAVYGREFVLEELQRRQTDAVAEESLEVSEFACRRLGDNTYLVTYRLVQGGWRVTRRATIWRWAEGAWQIVYHQGTMVAETL